MNTLQLTLQPLTQDAFSDFGDVMEVHENNHHFSINHGLTERHHALAIPDTSDNGGYAQISLFRSTPITLPFRIKLMERHPLGSQSFTMLSGHPYIAVVAKAGEFSPRNLRAFLVQPNQSINYHKGTWHHYCLCLNATCDFLVVDRGGPGNNCEEIEISDIDIRIEESN